MGLCEWEKRSYMKKPIIYLHFLFTGFILISSMNSCVNSKNLSYFNNIQRDTIVQMQAVPKLFIINKNDLLQVSIISMDVQTMAVLNATNGSPATSAGTSSSSPNVPVNGNLVDEKGYITLPLIGYVKAGGLSKEQLAREITKELIDKKIALAPIVSVRILNYKITVLGEVMRPGVIPVPNEKITLPEAIGLAGDLTPYGRRDNLLLIRQVDDKIVYKRFSMNHDQVFSKDLYYLQNDDILYVEPNKAKAGLSDRSTQTIPLVLSALSLVVVALAFAFRK